MAVVVDEVQQMITSLGAAMDATSMEHELKSRKELSTSNTVSVISNHSQKTIQYVNELQTCILEDNIVGLSQKLTEINFSNKR